MGIPLYDDFILKGRARWEAEHPMPPDLGPARDEWRLALMAELRRLDLEWRRLDEAHSD